MTVHVRRNVWTLPDGDLTLAHYAAAVAEMKSRDPQDPTSWFYQAAMHKTTVTPPKPLWNGCQHGSWFFLPWHRMYLYFFERIVRATVVDLGGPDDWALPFWAYDTGGTQARIPAAFRDPQGGTNPLFAQRGNNVNLGQALPFQITSPASALARPKFVGEAEFGGGITPDGDAIWNRHGQIELTPHGAVHNHLGGLMKNPRTAAQDPVFWLHHANIDRLWSVWASRPGHSDPTADPRWTDQEYRFFDADGTERTLTPAGVEDIENQLGYTYEPHPAITTPTPTPTPTPAPPPVPEMAAGNPGASGPARPERRELIGASRHPVRLVGRAASVAVPIDERTVRSLGTGLGAMAAEARGRVYLSVEDIEGDESPDTVYGIYVNLPDGAPDELAESHRVGNLPFFGIELAQDPRGDEHPHGLRVTVEITPLVRRLEAENAWDDREVRVTFLPLGFTEPVDQDDPPVQIGRVSLGYT
ncbi:MULTISPECIES: tyrosinase family protein [unclassified Streptomyces]|uniref:tyrosinase family protein n=1 Tax=unclassified Streptomyces TaxID=2593676 RepID=UPI0032532F01